MIILEIGSLRLLTDPVFDPPGGNYRFGLGTGSKKLTAPALSPDQVGGIDAVLLSHDHHEDNLDKAGRAFLPKAGRVLTTFSGGKRLGGNAEGMKNWQSTVLKSGDTEVKVTATPGQHGPLFIRPFAGETIGFMLEWEGQRHGALYISGDTVWFGGIAEVARRFRVGTAILHFGRAGFPITGPVRFTMNADDGVRAAHALSARAIIPIHYEGWAHFRESKTQIANRFAAAGLRDWLRWLPLGEPVECEV